MKVVLIISQSGLVHELSCISTLFEKYGYTILNYSLFDKSNNGDIPDYKSDLVHYIENNNIEICLWWYSTIPHAAVRYICTNTRGYNIFVGWNDPLIWSDKSSGIALKCRYFDLVVSMCSGTSHNYRDSGGISNIIQTLPGHDPSIFYPISNKIYTCDVSFCIGHLCTDDIYTDQLYPRRDLIDRLCSLDIVFHLYGPQYLAIRYPKNYRGFVKYSGLNNIYNSSRINISTHSSGVSGYINRRSLQILASGGLLLVDNRGTDGILSHTINCVYIDYDNVELQILELLDDDKYLSSIRDAGYKLSTEYKWDSWVANIHKFISLKYLDERYYRNCYNLADNISDVYEYWNQYGLSSRHIPYPVKVPDNFDYHKYLASVILSDLTIYSNRYLYWHYKIFSNSQLYLKKMDVKHDYNLRMICDSCNVDYHGWSNITHQFQSIYDSHTNISRENHLLNLSVLQSDYPSANINTLLRSYIEISGRVSRKTE